MIVSHLSRIDKIFIFFLLGTTKLAMKAVFGKTMENLRTHVYIELLSSAKFAEKRIAKPNLKGLKHFHDKLLAVELTR